MCFNKKSVRVVHHIQSKQLKDDISNTDIEIIKIPCKTLYYAVYDTSGVSISRQGSVVGRQNSLISRQGSVVNIGQIKTYIIDKPNWSGHYNRCSKSRRKSRYMYYEGK